MDLLTHALQGASAALPAPAAPADAALVVGAGGALGSALLAAALASGRFASVSALTQGPLQSALRGLRVLPAAALQDPAAGGPAGSTPVAHTAFVVFERERHANGRDDAFLQPQPPDLLPLARALHRRGVQRLLVVVPHAPALLPQALKRGLASLDEAAVAALGFTQLVFLRTATAAGGGAGGLGPIERLAGWWLSQLSWMVPQREQPVRAVRVAELAVTLALALRAAPALTRVLPPETLWDAAQAADPAAVFTAWLGLPARA